MRHGPAAATGVYAHSARYYFEFTLAGYGDHADQALSDAAVLLKELVSRSGESARGER